ncbi:uncharacterized protein VTP21DRAFT_3146 [Calcarisporiella thermophila]|uniref:uncharacterized protein n=1 Tax=Calcarisporiella thermophila TaxID=911321 RepID=UPI0037448910
MEISEEETRRYLQLMQDSLHASERTLQEAISVHQGYQSLKALLSDLPSKTSHQVMVPLGKCAFVPGKLIHTNEVMVRLGEEYFAERSASQACDIIDRRLNDTQEQIENLRKNVEEIKIKLEVAPGAATKSGTFTRGTNEEGLPIVEIMEEYHSDEEQTPKKVEKGKGREQARVIVQEKSLEEQKEDEDILARLRQLELEEEQDELEVNDEEPNDFLPYSSTPTSVEEPSIKSALRQSSTSPTRKQVRFREELSDDSEGGDEDDMDVIEEGDELLAAQLVRSLQTMRGPGEVRKEIKEVKERGLSDTGTEKKKLSRFMQQRQQASSDAIGVVKERNVNTAVAPPSKPANSTRVQSSQPKVSVFKQQKLQQQIQQTDPIHQTIKTNSISVSESSSSPAPPEIATAPRKMSRFKQSMQSSSSASSSNPKKLASAAKNKQSEDLMKSVVVERESEQFDDEEFEYKMQMKEISRDYYRRRHDMIAASGGFSFDGTKPDIPVIDDLLPIPGHEADDNEEEEEEQKKISLFKKSRLGNNFA